MTRIGSIDDGGAGVARASTRSGRAMTFTQDGLGSLSRLARSRPERSRLQCDQMALRCHCGLASGTLRSTALSSLFGHILSAVKAFGGQAKLGQPCRQPGSSALARREQQSGRIRCRHFARPRGPAGRSLPTSVQSACSTGRARRRARRCAAAAGAPSSRAGRAGQLVGKHHRLRARPTTPDRRKDDDDARPAAARSTSRSTICAPTPRPGAATR